MIIVFSITIIIVIITYLISYLLPKNFYAYKFGAALADYIIKIIFFPALIYIIYFFSYAKNKTSKKNGTILSNKSCPLCEISQDKKNLKCINCGHDFSKKVGGFIGLKLCPNCNAYQDGRHLKCPNCSYDISNIEIK